MKKLLMASKGEHCSVALRRAFVLLIGAALAFTFSMAFVPLARAADMTPAQMIQSQLPHGKTMGNARKTDLVTAVFAAVKKWPKKAALITKAAIAAHPEWRREILRTAITAVGTGNPNLVAAITAAAVQAAPDDANGLTELAIQLAPDSRDAIEQALAGGEGIGVFANASTGQNQNPLPGTIGGGGGGGFDPDEERVTMCDNNVEVLVLANQVTQYVATHPGASAGACQPTSVTNQ